MASKSVNQALGEGETAPDFQLEDLGGGRRAPVEKPVVLAFFKVNCPTCQYTFPFLERLYRGRANREISMLAISQDDAESTREFHKAFGVTMPTVLDHEEEGYPASNAYRLSNVPSIFLVEADGKISRTVVGFDRQAMEELGARLGKAPFEPGESVPDRKPG